MHEWFLNSPVALIVLFVLCLWLMLELSIRDQEDAAAFGIITLLGFGLFSVFTYWFAATFIHWVAIIITALCMVTVLPFIFQEHTEEVEEEGV